MITSTTAPARALASRFGTQTLDIALTGGMRLSVAVQDAAGNPVLTGVLRISNTDAQGFVYGVDGVPIVALPAVPVTNAATGVLTAFATTSGGIAAKFNGIDLFLQSQGLIPA